MKKIIAPLLALVLCLSLCACGGESVPTETPTTETPSETEYAIGEAFGTDSVECVITEVRWVTAEDVASHPELSLDFDNNGNECRILYASEMFPGYAFYGSDITEFSWQTTEYPYLCVTLTLQNVGKEIIQASFSNGGYEMKPYGNIAILYDDGYTFESQGGFDRILEVLGDANYEGRIFELPSQVFENEDKALKIKITLPASNGETEEFIVTVR